MRWRHSAAFEPIERGTFGRNLLEFLFRQQSHTCITAQAINLRMINFRVCQASAPSFSNQRNRVARLRADAGRQQEAAGQQHSATNAASAVAENARAGEEQGQHLIYDGFKCVHRRGGAPLHDGMLNHCEGKACWSCEKISNKDKEAATENAIECCYTPAIAPSLMHSM